MAATPPPGLRTPTYRSGSRPTPPPAATPAVFLVTRSVVIPSRSIHGVTAIGYHATGHAAHATPRCSCGLGALGATARDAIRHAPPRPAAAYKSRRGPWQPSCNAPCTLPTMAAKMLAVALVALLAAQVRAPLASVTTVHNRATAAGSREGLEPKQRLRRAITLGFPSEPLLRA